jgi:D-beta-D-heptose 7-phosphate kinase / D-beta-D-heptose 1-phosphate adenosyltransferase
MKMHELINTSPKILVIGDLMIDYYLWGSSDRISPEASVPVVKIHSENSLLGGAGNVISNLKSLGADVDIISVIGDCKISNELVSLINDMGINSEYLIKEKNRIGSKKHRIISSKQQVARFDIESTEEINNGSQKQILKIFHKIINNYDCLLISDYGKGVLTNSITKELIRISNESSIKVLIDPKGLNYEKYNNAYLLTPNIKEASEAIQIDIKDDATLSKAISKIKEKHNLDVSLITLSEHGVAVYDGEFRKHPTVAKEVFDVTGAGDTIIAALGYATACNKNIDDAVKFANLAAGVVVGKIGSSSATIEEIIKYESNLKNIDNSNIIIEFSKIEKIVSQIKTQNKKIVFTNGCFDILHLGHIKYLEEAKKCGDILIVGINSDESVKKLKGLDRPINSEYDRSYLLASLEIVDYVVVFSEETPFNLIKKIKPNILVKGGDYEGLPVIGEHIVDELKIVNFIEGKSTSETILNLQNKK